MNCIVPCASILWNNLRSIDINSLKVWYNFVLRHSGIGLFQNEVLTDSSVALGVINLFKLNISYLFDFDNWAMSRDLAIFLKIYLQVDGVQVFNVFPYNFWISLMSAIIFTFPF